MNAQTTNVTDLAGDDNTHRDFFLKLTDESLSWTPALDACLRTYFWLQSGFPAETHPMEVMKNFGNSVGIAQALHAGGQITDRHLYHLNGFAARRMVEKLMPWNGCDFTVSASYGRPAGVTTPTLQ